MIVINRKADVFFFNNTRKIYVFLAGRIVEIEDNDDCLMASFLRWAYEERSGDPGRFIKKLKLSCDIDELKNALKELIKKNILLNKDVRFVRERRFVNPFVPFRFRKNIWGVRNGKKFFFFIASSRLEAVKKTKEMALSWIDEAEAGIVSGSLERKIECLPAKINVPEIKRIKLNKDCILIYNSFSKKSKTYEKFSKQTKGFDFWRELSRRAVGEIGIVPIVKKVLGEGGPFSLSVPTFLSCHKLLSLRGRSDDWQIGRDRELEIAKGKSIMEAIERYCGRRKLSGKNLVFSSVEELGVSNCLSPSDIATYSKLQFEKGWLKGITDFKENLKTNWVRVRNFKRNEFKFVPECFVSYPETDSRYEKIHRFFFANSNGVAAHMSINKSVEKAVLEIIERDAILIYWINRISPNRIVFSGRCPDFFLDIKRKLNLLGYQLALLDLTLDTVPVVMSVAYRKNGDSGFFCGAAAGTSKVDAIRRSIEELEFTVWARLKDPIRLKREVKSVKIEAIWKPSHHEIIYLKPSMGKYLEFLYKGKEIRFNKSDLNAKKDVFVALENIGKEIYYVDLTTEDVRNLNLGIRVVRCIVPGLIPITFGYGYEPLAMERIYENSLNDNLCEKDVVKNYLPHFFP